MNEFELGKLIREDLGKIKTFRFNLTNILLLFVLYLDFVFDNMNYTQLLLLVILFEWYIYVYIFMSLLIIINNVRYYFLTKSPQASIFCVTLIKNNEITEVLR